MSKIASAPEVEKFGDKNDNDDDEEVAPADERIRSTDAPVQSDPAAAISKNSSSAAN